MKEKAKKIPEQIAKEFKLEPEEVTELYRILYKLLKNDDNQINNKESLNV